MNWKKKFAADWGRWGMRSDWDILRADKFIDFNPTETIRKGELSKKVAMEQLQPYTRDISGYELTPFNGGSKFRNGDTLMARITPCLENGKTAQVNILENDEVGFGSTEFIVMREIPGVSDSDFIYYLALSPFWRNKAIKSMVGSSGRQRVQQGVLDSVELCVPPLPEQKEIAHTLRALDDIIFNNKEINLRLEKMAQAIFKSWFVDFEPWGGVMPEDWETTSLSALCSLISRGITPKYVDQGEQIVINQKCIRDHQVVLGPSRFHEPKTPNDKWLQYGDVLVNSTGQGTLGRAAQWLESLTNVTVDSHVSIVRPNTPQYVYYLGLYVTGKEKEIEAMAAGSTGQTELSRERLGSLLLLQPKSEQLEEFNKLVEPLMTQIVTNNHESERLVSLRDVLLPKLMSGELSIPID